MRFLFFIIFLLAISHGFSQNKYKEFGDVTKEDFKIASTQPADAIVLFDKGEVVVEPGSVIGTTFKRHIRIKILTRNALSRGNFEFLVEKGGFRKPKGITYNLEKEVIIASALESSSIMESPHNKYYDQINISFPNVKEESIIEFSYILKFENLYLPTWEFQNTIPVLWSQYTINAPIKDYLSHLRGQLKPSDYEEKYEGRWRSWTMTDIPAFLSEPLMPDKDAYISSIEFGTQTKNWEGVRNNLLSRERFAGVVLKHNYLKRKVNELLKGVTDSVQMIKIISDNIKKEIAYDGTNGFFSDDPSEVFTRKSGSAGDINLIFASMLKKAGFNVSLILLSTRNHGFILDSFPSITQFNYVISYIQLNGKEYFLDATEKFLPFDVLPEKCYNHKGFLVSLKEYGWIPLEPTQRNKVYITSNLLLQENGDLTGTVKVSRYDYAAFHARKDTSETKQKEFKEVIFGSTYKTLNVDEVLNSNDIEKPLIETYKATLEKYADVAADRIYLKPHIFYHSENNPFTASTREYPIDFPELIDIYITVNFTIPNEYQIDELPESKLLTLPGNAARYSTNIKAMENQIIFNSRLQINQELFQPHEYPNLKEFYSRMIAKKSELITLRKK